MTFWERKGNVTAAGYTVTSKVGLEKVEPSTSQPSVKKFHRDSRKVSEQSAMKNLATIESSSNSHNTEEKKTLTSHGTGSNIAKTKIELEKQWLKHLQLKEERDENKEERNKNLIESKKEGLKLKKRHLAMKEKEMEQRHDIVMNKMSEKRKRHFDIMEIERLKYKLLKKFIEKRKTETLTYQRSQIEDVIRTVVARNNENPAIFLNITIVFLIICFVNIKIFYDFMFYEIMIIKFYENYE